MNWTVFLWQWEWRPEVVFSLGAFSLIYVLGWFRLRSKGAKRLASTSRFISYLLGIVVLVIALLSPVDTLQSFLFSMHMVQHLLLTMVAAPLIILGTPFPIGLHALHRPLRHGFVLLLGSNGPLRNVVKQIGRPLTSLFVFIGTFWLWHTPQAYTLALRYDIIHDIEHISFFVTGLFFWWHVTNTPPRFFARLGYGWRIALLALGFVQNEVLSVALSFASTPWYSYYEHVPQISGLTPLQDQQLGGAIMWVPGGMMYIIAIIVLLARLLDAEEKKAVLPLETWGQEDAVRAPGWE